LKKILSFLILILLFVTNISIIPAENDIDRTIIVDDDNINGPWDGSWEYPFQTIHDAINDSKDGETIYVLKGTYYERTIIIDKQIDLIGENEETTIIYNKNDDQVVKIVHPNIALMGFTVRNAKSEGVLVLADNVTLRNLILIDNGFNNIRIFSSNNCSILFSTSILNNSKGLGIKLIKSNNCNIFHFTTLGMHQIGINLESSNNNDISSCKDYGSNIGIRFSNSNNNQIGQYYSTNNTCFGILIGNSSTKNFLLFCKIYNCSLDCYSIESSDNNSFLRCHSENSTRGFYFLRSNMNEIKNCNFINNKNHATFEYSYKNTWIYNYWDTSNSILPKLIRGKIEIKINNNKIEIPWLNFDWFTEQKPFDI